MSEENSSSSSAILRRYVPGLDGTPLVWYEGSDLSQPHWLVKDQQGSVVAITTPDGQVPNTQSYDPYGMAGSSGVTGRFGYAGQTFLPEAGLYNMGARTYSPALGRFLQTDPIGYGDGMNWYSYTHNDPVNGTDPMGLDDDPNYGPQVQGGNGGDGDSGGDGGSGGSDGGGGSGGGATPPTPTQYCTGSAFCSGPTGGVDPALDGGCSGNCGGTWVPVGKQTVYPDVDYQNLDGSTKTFSSVTSAETYTYVSNSSSWGGGGLGLTVGGGMQQGMPQAIRISNQTPVLPPANDNRSPQGVCRQALNACRENAASGQPGDPAVPQLMQCGIAYNFCLDLTDQLPLLFNHEVQFFNTGVVLFPKGGSPYFVPYPR